MYSNVRIERNLNPFSEFMNRSTALLLFYGYFCTMSPTSLPCKLNIITASYALFMDLHCEYIDHFQLFHIGNHCAPFSLCQPLLSFSFFQKAGTVAFPFIVMVMRARHSVLFPCLAIELCNSVCVCAARSPLLDSSVRSFCVIVRAGAVL